MAKKINLVNSDSGGHASFRSRRGVGKASGSITSDFNSGKVLCSPGLADSVCRNPYAVESLDPSSLSNGHFRLSTALPFEGGYIGIESYEDSASFPDSNKENNFDSFKEVADTFCVDDEVIRTFYHLGHLLWLQQMKPPYPPPPPPPPRVPCQSSLCQTELLVGDIEGMGNRLAIFSHRIDGLVEDSFAKDAALASLRQVLSEVSADRDSQVEGNQQTISRLTLELIGLKEELGEARAKAHVLERSLAYYCEEV